MLRALGIRGEGSYFSQYFQKISYFPKSSVFAMFWGLVYMSPYSFLVKYQRRGGRICPTCRPGGGIFGAPPSIISAPSPSVDNVGVFITSNRNEVSGYYHNQSYNLGRVPQSKYCNLQSGLLLFTFESHI